MRLFIAINLPAIERRAIREATAPLREASSGVAWVSEDCLHVTMKFLGEQPDDASVSMRGALAAVSQRYRPMSLAVGGVGAFPNLRDPRTFWLAVAHDPKLELLHHELEVTCQTLGYEVEARPFRPHVTLGRVKRSLSREQARTLAGTAGAVRYTRQIEVRSVDLMSSVLTSAGPRYSVVAALPLGAA